MKSIIDHRNRRRSAIDNRLSAIIATPLLIPHGGLCPWPTFHAWVTMVRKKWLSPYYITYWCYIHQTCINCSSWHVLLMPCGGLCPWPTVHAWVTMVRKKWLCPYYSTHWSYIHQTWTNCSSLHDLLIPHGGLCPWTTFHASVTKTQNGYSGAPVMVPITIMSSWLMNSNRKLLHGSSKEIWYRISRIFRVWNFGENDDMTVCYFFTESYFPCLIGS